MLLRNKNNNNLLMTIINTVNNNRNCYHLMVTIKDYLFHCGWILLVWDYQGIGSISSEYMHTELFILFPYYPFNVCWACSEILLSFLILRTCVSSFFFSLEVSINFIDSFKECDLEVFDFVFYFIYALYYLLPSASF